MHYLNHFRIVAIKYTINDMGNFLTTHIARAHAEGIRIISCSLISGAFMPKNEIYSFIRKCAGYLCVSVQFLPLQSQ